MKLNYLKSNNNKKLKDEKIEAIIDKFKFNNVGFFMQLPMPKLRRIYKNKFPIYRADKIKCESRYVPFFRNFLIVNQIKFKTCKRVYNNISLLANIEFKKYLI